MSTSRPTPQIDRRHFLQASALLCLLVPATGTISQALAASSDFGSSAGLSPRGRTLIDALAATILPKTTTPGAHEVGTVDFIDLILTKWATPEQQALFFRGLAELDRTLTAKTGTTFERLPADKRLAVLTPIDAAAYPLPTGGPFPFIVLLKSLTLSSYYTSEAGTSAELEVTGTLGSYEACMHSDSHATGESVLVSLHIPGFN